MGRGLPVLGCPHVPPDITRSLWPSCLCSSLTWDCSPRQQGQRQPPGQSPATSLPLNHNNLSHLYPEQFKIYIQLHYSFTPLFWILRSRMSSCSWRFQHILAFYTLVQFLADKEHKVVSTCLIKRSIRAAC